MKNIHLLEIGQKNTRLIKKIILNLIIDFMRDYIIVKNK